MRPNQGAKMSNDPKTIYLKDYQPPTYLIPEVDLSFELDEEKSFVTAELKVERNPDSNDTSKELFLDGEKLNLIDVELNGSSLSETQYELTDSSLTIKDCPDNFQLKTIVELKPQENKAFSGLYKTKTVFCTQMEAQGFRRTTFFQDRPDVLSKYKVSLKAKADKYPVLLSNGNFIEEKNIEDGYKLSVWEDPFPKPCYLFALVAGDLDWIEDTYKTKSGKDVALKIFVNKGQTNRAHFAMESLKQSMKWDEDTYGLEYDLEIYNIVAVDDFNMGAMENKGLNIFNSKYVLASSDTATDEEYQGIQRVIGHEYFHNWSGNRVTCRDWFQLSLKEGLTVYRDQEFSSDLNSRPVKRIEDVSALRSRQFPEDSGPMAHPVRPASYIAIDNFYTVTIYEKGAEVIRMLHNLLGDEAFYKGATHYFKTHDGQAVTTDDWIKAMEVASGRDLTQFKNWYNQAGTPQISVNTQYDETSKQFTIELQQKTLNPITKEPQKPFQLPLKFGLVSQSGAALSFEMDSSTIDHGVIELTEDTQKIILNKVQEKPILSINREFSAPIQLNFEQKDEDLYLLMTSDPDSFNRWESAQKLYRQCLIQMYRQLQKGETATVPAELANAVKNLIENGLKDPALTACLITPPSTQYLAQFITDIDPQILGQAYKEYTTQVSKHVNEVALKIYQDLSAKDLKDSASDQALRSFKNRLIFFIHRENSDEGNKLFKQQFDNSANMTDTLAALWRLRFTDSEEFEATKKSFRDQWHNDDLVMNKLFSINAIAKGEKTFENIKKVMNSEDFDRANPNNLYSLVYTFAQHNWSHFHQKDGSVYDWFADLTIEVDQRNPQVASRLGSCFNQWKKFAPEYQTGMKKALEKIRNSDPSNNLFEIVSRALTQ